MSVTLEAIYEQQREILKRLDEIEVRGEGRRARDAGSGMPVALTVQDLAVRWRVHPETIRGWVRTRSFGLKPFTRRPYKFSATLIRKIEEREGFPR